MKSFAQTMITTAVAYKVTQFGRASVEAFGDFNQAITESAAIMTGMTGQMQNEMKKTALELSGNSATSATDLGKAYYYLASAGLNAKQAIAALPTVEQFATAGMFDMAKATDLLTDAQSALGLVSKDTNINMENMTRLSDVLVKANTLANASVEQFSAALTNKAGASLRLLNKDVEEGVAVLAAFADQGLKDSAAGSALSIVLRDMQKAALTNASAWQNLGMSVYDSNGKMLRISDIIRQLEGRFGSMSDEQKKTTATMLGFQDKSFGFIQALIGASDKIDAYEASLRKAGGTTKSVADKQMSAFNMKMKQMWNQVKMAGIGIGETLAPAITGLTSVLVVGARALDGYISRLDKVGRVAAEHEAGFLKTSLVGLLALDPIVTPLIAHATGPSEGKGQRQIASLKGEVKDILDYIESGTPGVDTLNDSLSFLADSMGDFSSASEAALTPLQEFVNKIKADAVPAIDRLRESYNMIIDASEGGMITDTEKVSAMASAWKDYSNAVGELAENGTLVELSLQMERLQEKFAAGGIDKVPFDAQMQELEAMYQMQSDYLNGSAQFVESIKNIFSDTSPFVEYMKALYEGMKQAYQQSQQIPFFNMQQGGPWAPQVGSSGMQMMDISTSRFQAPGVAATMSASEAASMAGGGLEDIGRQQLTTQKNIETGINQMNFLLARGLI